MSKTYCDDPIPMLSVLSARTERHRDFMGYVIREYLNSEGLAEHELCLLLGITPELLVRLSLCKRPDSNQPDFLERVNTIADYTICDEHSILQLIRHVDSLDALRKSGRDVMLSAARDRQLEESKPSQNSSEGGNVDRVE